MAELSTKPIQKQRQRLLKKTRAIISDYKHLEDALFYLSKNHLEIKANISQYVKLLSDANIQFLLGDEKSYGVLDKLIWEAQADFAASMKKFDIAKYKERGQNLAQAVKREFVTDSTGYYNRLRNGLLSRADSLKVMSEVSKIPKNALKEIGQRELLYSLNRPDGSVIHYRKKQIDNAFNSLTKRYGRYDEAIYGWRQGKEIHFPLRSWVDMRTRTTSQEVHRLTTTVEATANQIYTGKISAHGSKDSCIFHENRIAFFSQGAKEQFIQLYPDVTEAKSWPTMEELKADNTHLFKPNCRHIVTAYPFYLFDKKDVTSEIKENPPVKIPSEPEKAAKRMIA